MGYQALYRKWRPATFDEVCGQAEVVKMLRAQMESGKISHAYLLCGTRGTGKTTIAKILAKAVNCPSLKDGNPCGVCDSCTSISQGSCVDVVEIDAASNNGVDNVRQLREEVVYTPAVSRFRVYIIDEVHMLSNQAFNALLKTLEEPPSHVIFILATTDPEKLPATILSRCQRFDFKPLSDEILAARLCAVCEGEGFEADEKALSLIAYLANGGMRDALSILDQCSSAGNKITYESVAALTGLGARSYISSLLDAVSEKRYDEAIRLSSRLAAEGKSFALACEELLSCVRDMLIIKSVDRYESLLTCPPSEVPMLVKQADNFSNSRLLALADTLLAEKEKLGRGGGRQIDFELLLFRLCSPETQGEFAALEERVRSIEKLLANGVPTPAKAPASAPAPKPAKPAPTRVAEAPKHTAAPVKEDAKAPSFWAELVKKSEPSLSVLLNSCKGEIVGEKLIIYAPKSRVTLLKMEFSMRSLKHTLSLVASDVREVEIREKAEAAIDPFSQIEGFKIID